jgi:DNA-binding MarR family transcriptional regulator
MMPLTPKQKRAELIIRELMDANNGVPPTGKELAEVLKVTVPSAYSLIRGMMARGWATKVKGRPHSLQLIEGDRRA